VCARGWLTLRRAVPATIFDLEEETMYDPFTLHRHAGNTRRCHRALVAMLFLALGAAVPRPMVQAQDAPAAEPSASPTPAGPTDQFRRGVPRSAVRGYLEACWARDHARAANYLDLRRLPPAQRDAEGPGLAQQLCQVLDRTLWIDPEVLSGDKLGLAEDGLPPRRDLVGTVTASSGPVDILVERVPREDGTLIWKISSATVARIPELYEEFRYGPITERLPAPLHDIRFLDIALWQWLAVGILLVAAVGVAWLLSRVVVWILRLIVRRTYTQLDDRVLRSIVGPLRVAFGLLFFYSGIVQLSFSARVRALVDSGGQLLAIAVVTWIVLRIVDAFARAAEDRYFGPRRQIAALAPLARRTMKAFIILIAALATMQNLGLNVNSLLAGLGIGGLAVALAAQKTVEHLFGGVTLVTDQPIRVGDFCRFGDRVGTVEDIGLRSTRIRTLDRTVISVPNGDFSSMQIENFSKRDRIWLQTTIGVRYETSPDQLRFLLIEIKRLLLGHPLIDPEPARVRFVRFGAFSLDIEIFAYVLTADMNEFHAIREDLFLRIMEVVAGSGTSFAFPSSTTYVAPDSGLDAERKRAAEAQVHEWRAAQELCLPDFPSDQAAKIRGKLRYPPEGAAVRGR
jgi:MscS family membrane protein